MTTDGSKPTVLTFDPNRHCGTVFEHGPHEAELGISCGGVWKVGFITDALTDAGEPPFTDPRRFPGSPAADCPQCGTDSTAFHVFGCHQPILQALALIAEQFTALREDLAKLEARVSAKRKIVHDPVEAQEALLQAVTDLTEGGSITDTDSLPVFREVARKVSSKYDYSWLREQMAELVYAGKVIQVNLKPDRSKPGRSRTAVYTLPDSDIHGEFTALSLKIGKMRAEGEDIPEDMLELLAELRIALDSGAATEAK